MKGSTILVIGGIVVVGFVAYEIYKHCQSPNSNRFDDTPSPENSKEKTDMDSNPTADSHISDFIQTKESAATTIKETHEEAAKVIKESLETIFDDKPKENVETENSESLDRIDDELDNLLE